MIPPELEAMFQEIQTPVIFATVDEYPHATPMNWLWLPDEGVFWFNPAGGTRKIRLLRKNGNVCFATVEGMKKGGRGFMVWGVVERFEYGFWALGRNWRIKARMLREKSEICFDRRILRFWLTYARHPDIHYSTLPWNAAFVRIRPKRIVYWLEDQVEREVTP
ncbi:MAG: pyridoxamine 5'-phosphate oxidase family protein [Methanobacteriota archaeon]|nr:MAG: pyridoxamine 5'-phosphate oxidase family protein [Euryarchaeota archaeon]